MNSEVFGSPLFVRRAASIVQEIASLADLSISPANGHQIAET